MLIRALNPSQNKVHRAVLLNGGLDQDEGHV
jgi:hypothetical protein